MVNAHSKSFFGQKVGMIISSSSETDPFIFLKFLKKKANNEWEKPSKGEGKTIKISIEEMITLLDVLNTRIPKWNSFHSFKNNKTSINVNWGEKEEVFWIRADEYAKSLRYPQTKFIQLLLDHLLKEKIVHATSGKKFSKDSNMNEVNAIDTLDDLFLEQDLIQENDPKEYFFNAEREKNNNLNNPDDLGIEVRARIKRSTDKAVLLALKNGSESWFPKSSICSDFDKDSQIFLVKKWILEKNNICNAS